MAAIEKAQQVGASASNQEDSSQGQEERRKKKADLELAYKDQGYHEMEFISGNESELHERKQHCQKNPGHLDFIPAGEFTMDHLPEHWRDSLVFDYITALISLTVRLAVGYTSRYRPPNYPLYYRRGQYGMTAFGSGTVWSVVRKFKEKDDHTCPCDTCKQSPHLAKKQWCEFDVVTARHVVFDNSEAKHTKCNLFFDSDEDRYNCLSVEGGFRIWSTHVRKDDCWMTCITHDKEISEKLEKMVQHCRELRNQVGKKYYNESGLMNRQIVAVVISHPHGLCKHVTLGEVTRREEIGWDRLIYGAETCAGSSGGTVCILGDLLPGLKLTGPWYASHSGCQHKGQNESVGFLE